MSSIVPWKRNQNLTAPFTQTDAILIFPAGKTENPCPHLDCRKYRLACSLQPVKKQVKQPPLKGYLKDSQIPQSGVPFTTTLKPVSLVTGLFNILFDKVQAVPIASSVSS